MEYLSIKQTPDQCVISIRRTQVLCTEGRIPGAMKIGSYWLFQQIQRNRTARELKW